MSSNYFLLAIPDKSWLTPLQPHFSYAEAQEGELSGLHTSEENSLDEKAWVGPFALEAALSQFLVSFSY